MRSSISQKAINGTFWTVSASGLSKIATLASMVVLARLLFPEDFGVFALAGTVIGAVGAFTELGATAAVIYEQRPDPEHTNSAFWIEVSAGVLQTLVIFVGAQWISGLYGEPELRDILVVLSIAPMLSSLGYLHGMLLAKELRFKAKAVLDVAPGLSSAVISVILALLGFDVWSMVFGMLSSLAITSALAWCLVPWRPYLHFDLTQARAIMNYGKAILGTTVMIFLSDNIDYMIVGRILGSASLGLYSQAFRLATYPETAIAWPVEKVAFPTFSKLRSNQEALHSAFLKIIQYMALVSFPALTLLIILSQQLILTLFGDKWEGAILPLQVLCILGMSRSVTATSKQLLMAVGRPDITFKCNLAVLPGAAVGVYIGTQFGIVGVAVAMTAFLCIGAWALLLLAGRQIDLSAIRMIGALQPAVVTSLVAVAGLLLIRAFVSDALSTVGILNLAYSILLGCSLCLVSLVLFSRHILIEVLETALSFRRGREDAVWTGTLRQLTKP